MDGGGHLEAIRQGGTITFLYMPLLIYPFRTNIIRGFYCRQVAFFSSTLDVGQIGESETFNVLVDTKYNSKRGAHDMGVRE